ncbi:response regulator transcription factor [Undibacterium squillarum]|uniref:DNA-binding response regulator n=1 Tax=Undibacterium squillarum TaxID=1131567 RepID=A0ABQ2XUV4_9BURK|nr:response regulator transcription factor [Undibacterium squillarum]GGX34653.1 DNA-binding response regulator [Undibacterium squillarum]
MKILLIEDEARIANFVCAGLAGRGYTMCHCSDGRSGLQAAMQRTHDLILLDVMLPEMDGLTLLRKLREQGILTPVILLTARNELQDRIEGLNLGADDYLAKPFFVEELAARIQAIQRRLSGDHQHLLQVGPLQLDRLNRQVRCHQHDIDLTSREFTLLEFLMRSNGQTLTRGQILEHVWGYDFDPSTNVVDVCIRRLRSKIAELDPDLSPIESVRGTGYRFRTGVSV